MTIQEASERYQISMHILREYESWGLCGAVKKVMGAWQYDDTDLERLSAIMTLHDIGFTTEEVELYMRLLLEQNDPNARPALSGTLEHPEDYNVVFLGYPIWWGQAPKVICAFLESCDFGDATIIPFCTSGSSGIGGSLEELQALAPNARWLDGQRFDSGADQNEVAQWVDSLGLGL